MKKMNVESIFCQMAPFSLHQNCVNEAKILRVIFFPITFEFYALCDPIFGTMLQLFDEKSHKI